LLEAIIIEIDGIFRHCSVKMAPKRQFLETNKSLPKHPINQLFFILTGQFIFKNSLQFPSWIEANKDGREPIPRVVQQPRVIIEVAAEALDPDALRAKMTITDCGAVVSFVGVTRGDADGVSVERLEFDAWESKLPEVLTDLANQAIEKFGINSVAMSHRVGSVEPEQPIVAIHVAATHRAEAFAACSWLIDSLKEQAPLWRKEVRADGVVWKGGLG
jgi:molybdopterin synthase catalytic subunit